MGAGWGASLARLCPPPAVRCLAAETCVCARVAAHAHTYVSVSQAHAPTHTRAGHTQASSAEHSRAQTPRARTDQHESRAQLLGHAARQLAEAPNQVRQLTVHVPLGAYRVSSGPVRPALFQFLKRGPLQWRGAQAVAHKTRPVEVGPLVVARPWSRCDLIVVQQAEHVAACSDEARQQTVWRWRTAPTGSPGTEEQATTSACCALCGGAVHITCEHCFRPAPQRMCLGAIARHRVDLAEWAAVGAGWEQRSKMCAPGEHRGWSNWIVKALRPRRVNPGGGVHGPSAALE